MKKAYQKTCEEIYKELNTSVDGLSSQEVTKRRQKYGLKAARRAPQFSKR